MKIVKILLAIIILIVIFILITMVYWSRSQTINFANMLPNNLKYCEQSISLNDREYIELKKWFELNQKDWKNTPASYFPKNYYFGSKININVLGNNVIVNYIDSDKNKYQVVRSKKQNELITTCK